jgi:regulator of protease activity HflC (stomatin/prohibitin superfamily)
MEGIRKVPFILGCLAAMVTGTVSYAAGAESRTVYMRMAIVMVVFFILGVYIRNTVLALKKEIEKKKDEQEAAEEEKLRQEQESQKTAAAKQPAAAADQDAKANQAGQQAHTLDLTADDSEDEFKPLTVSRVVSSKMKE